MANNISSCPALMAMWSEFEADLYARSLMYRREIVATAVAEVAALQERCEKAETELMELKNESDIMELFPGILPEGEADNG